MYMKLLSTCTRYICATVDCRFVQIHQRARLLLNYKLSKHYFLEINVKFLFIVKICEQLFLYKCEKPGFRIQQKSKVFANQPKLWLLLLSWSDHKKLVNNISLSYKETQNCRHCSRRVEMFSYCVRCILYIFVF